jgi:hypothetical protein
MDSDQIKKEKRKAGGGGGGGARPSGAGEGEEEERRQLPCWNLLVSGKRTVLFQSCQTPSFTQLIEKGYIWPAMIEGNVGTPPKNPQKVKNGFHSCSN